MSDEGRFAGGNTPPADQGTRDPADTRNHQERINPDDGLGFASLRGGSVKTDPVREPRAEGLAVQRPSMALPPADQPASRPYQLLEAAFIRDLRYAAGAIVHLMPHEVGPHMVPVDTVGTREEEVARKREVLDAAQRDFDAAVERHEAAKSDQSGMSAEDEKAQMDERFGAMKASGPERVFHDENWREDGGYEEAKARDIAAAKARDDADKAAHERADKAEAAVKESERKRAAEAKPPGADNAA
jgi:hypothetical protein